VNPYRPLHVARDEPPERTDPELRGLAVVLVILGGSRVIPALVDGKLDLPFPAGCGAGACTCGDLHGCSMRPWTGRFMRS